MTNSKNNEKKTIKKYKVLNEKKAHKGNREKSTRVDEENKNRNTGIVKKKKNWNLCVTSKIYLECYNANWNLKCKPLKLQDFISLWAVESHKNSIPIKCDKFPKITAASPFFQSQNFTLCSYFIYHFLYLEF